MKVLTSFWLTVVIVLALLAWAKREMIQPSLIMSPQDVLRAKAAADKPLWMPWCKWEVCRLS
jgi:hypothetical protein